MTQIATTPSTTGGFSRAAAESLAQRRQEPAWLRELRLQAFETYQALPLEEPSTGNWRRASLRGLDLANQDPLAVADVQPALTVSPSEGLAALATQRDGAPALVVLGAEAQAAGVRVLDLADAVRDEALGATVRQHFGQVVRPTADKFAALHYAFLNAGLLVLVPRNVTLSQPIVLRYASAAPGAAAFVHTLVVVGDNADVQVIEEVESPLREGAPLASGVLELVAGGNSQVRFAAVQRFATDVWSFLWQKAVLGRDAHVRLLNVALGARTARNTVQVELRGNGSQADLLGIVAGNGRQHVDFQTLQDHFGNATRSDLVIHNALRDQSSSNFTGLIRINKESRQTESSQEQKNILLSPKAKADSDPKLEILNNDVVRCTHGAAVGPVDPENVFYLQSRGMPREVAEALIVEGFFNSVVQTLAAPAMEHRIWAAVQEKIGSVETAA